MYEPSQIQCPIVDVPLPNTVEVNSLRTVDPDDGGTLVSIRTVDHAVVGPLP